MSTDREALVALYKATDGANWWTRTNWNTDAPLSEWHGVKVNDQGRVVELDLSENNLIGHIPPELGALSELQKLILYSNKLTGPIPPELGNLGALQHLNISLNEQSGPIPRELGNLAALQDLNLGENELSGPIPSELGRLSALKALSLYRNQLSGEIPASLGQLTNLQTLNLGNIFGGNKLTGPIPRELGNLASLQLLALGNNELSGPIPPELGRLSALKALFISGNQLSGHIPPQLGQLGALQHLKLAGNKLDGPIPPELGELAALTDLDLRSNQLTGPIPPELGQLAALEQLGLSNNQLSGPIPPELGNLRALTWLTLGGNELSGGLEPNESLTAWRTRLQSKLAEQRQAEEQRRRGAEERPAAEEQPRREAEARQAEKRRAEELRVLGEQVASFSDLYQLTTQNREALEEVKLLLEKNAAAGSSSSGTELADTAKLRELDNFIAMAKTLDEMTARYAEDMDIQRKEMSFDPGRKAYNVVIRSGLCNAYLAASVVCSGLVSTSKVGAMGKAGAALKIISGSVPLVGGLAGFAGAALKAGDRFIQTRRLEKVTDLALDPVECSMLAKSLALRLTDGLADDVIAPPNDDKDTTHILTSVGWGAGESKSSQCSGALTDGGSEEAAMDWFVDWISEDYEPGSCGATTETRESKARKRLGRRHLRMLLTAVGRDCLEGTSNTREKVDALVRVILPEASIHPTGISSSGEHPRMRPPVLAPAHDAGLDQAAKLATMMATLEAQQAEIEKQRAEIKKQQAKMEKMEKHLPKSQAGPGGARDAGGLIFAQQQQTETQEEFNERMENPARAPDQQSVTRAEVRDIQAHVEEIGSETGHLGARVAALEETKGKRKKKGLRFGWYGKR